MLRHLFVCALEVRVPCFRRALFGVVRSPQTVLRRWWINVASAVSLIESSQKIGRSHHRHRPGRDVFPAVLREPFDLVIARYAATSFFDQLNSVPPEPHTVQNDRKLARDGDRGLSNCAWRASSPKLLAPTISARGSAARRPLRKDNCVAWRHHTSRCVPSSRSPRKHGVGSSIQHKPQHFLIA